MHYSTCHVYIKLIYNKQVIVYCSHFYVFLMYASVIDIHILNIQLLFAKPAANTKQTKNKKNKNTVTLIKVLIKVT